MRRCFGDSVISCNASSFCRFAADPAGDGMNKSCVVIGGGAHARVLMDALLLSGVKIQGFTDLTPKQISLHGKAINYLGTDEEFLKKPHPEDIQLVNGVGSVGDPERRREIFNRFKEAGCSFLTVIHPSAIVAKDVTLGEGVQVMAGAIVQIDSKLGSNVIINTRASVDHDCAIGDHVHIAPGAVLSGNVTVGESAHVGTGASVVQGIRIPAGTLVKAGSVISHSPTVESVVS